MTQPPPTSGGSSPVTSYSYDNMGRLLVVTSYPYCKLGATQHANWPENGPE